MTGDTRFEEFFKKNNKAIKLGQQQNSGEKSKRDAWKLIEELKDKAEPFVLQRSIKEHLKDQLPPKEEYVIWVKPSDAIWKATKKILESDDTEHAKISENRFCIFAVIQRLRMAAIHPFFAGQVTDANVKDFLNDDEGEVLGDEERTGKDFLKSSDILKDAPSIRVCKDLIVDLTLNGHKVLVFSQYRKPLDFLGYVLEHSNIAFYRIVGNTPQDKRNKYIKSFNNDSSKNIQVMLMTIGVGGLGLTLTGADCVILLGASWNPMKDAQAVGRAFRISQTRPVKVYRLLMASLIDEKVYGKQVQKDALIREVQTETGGCLTRLFDDKELSKLLEIGDRHKCNILDLFPHRVIGASEKLLCLNTHPKVQGIMHHAALYQTFSNRFGGSNKRKNKRSLVGSDMQNKGSKKVICIEEEAQSPVVVSRVQTSPSCRTVSESGGSDDSSSN